VVPPPTDEETLDRLVKLLESGREMDAHDRATAAWYLRRLRLNSTALTKLNGRGRGRPSSFDAPKFALEYLVRKELLGHRRSKQALAEVAKSWRISRVTVKDAFTDWQAAAKYRLSQLIDNRIGKLRVGTLQPDGSYQSEYWTRRELLEAVRDDLRDEGQAHRAGRGK